MGVVHGDEGAVGLDLRYHFFPFFPPDQPDLGSCHRMKLRFDIGTGERKGDKSKAIVLKHMSGNADCHVSGKSVDHDAYFFHELPPVCRDKTPL